MGLLRQRIAKIYYILFLLAISRVFPVSIVPIMTTCAVAAFDRGSAV